MPSPRPLQLSARDLALLDFLAWTPATAAQLQAVSETFVEPFADERRVRERLQDLVAAGYVRVSPLVACVGAPNCYRLAPDGFRLRHAPGTPLPPRAFFEATPPSRGPHTQALAATIVHARLAAFRRRIQVVRFFREGSLTLRIGDRTVQPDCFFQFRVAGAVRNVCFEIDRGTETVDSLAYKSLRDKLVTYGAYADWAIAAWSRDGRRGPRPHFRVAFLTTSAERARHIAALARDLAFNPQRHLALAGAADEFLASPDALREPLFFDHHGRFTALCDPHPTSQPLREPVRLPPPMPLDGVLPL